MDWNLIKEQEVQLFVVKLITWILVILDFDVHVVNLYLAMLNFREFICYTISTEIYEYIYI